MFTTDVSYDCRCGVPKDESARRKHTEFIFTLKQREAIDFELKTRYAIAYNMLNIALVFSIMLHTLYL